MEQARKGFAPIRLIDTKRITRKGYYHCRIVRAHFQQRNGKEVLTVHFEVIKGRHAGFTLSTDFWDTFKSRARLSHLCCAVGIIGELKSIDLLVGKTLKLRIVPDYENKMGRTFINYRITMFHHADRKL